MNTKCPAAKKSGLVTLVVVVVIVAAILGGPLEQLAFGWLYFPLRVVPLLTPDWLTVILAVISSVAFVTGLHVTLRWFIQETSVKTTAPLEWTWRTTSAVSALILLLFVVGTAMVGATHQFVWLLSGRAKATAEHAGGPRPLIPTMIDLVIQAREAARQSQEKNNLKSFGMAFHGAADDDKGTLPPGGVMTEDGTLLHGWAALIHGYDYFLREPFDYRIPWNQPPNDRVYKCQSFQFINPSQSGPYFDEEGYGLSHIAGNSQVLPIRTVTVRTTRAQYSSPKEWYATPTKGTRGLNLAEISDGTSNTILLGTVGAGFKPWGHPANVRDPSEGINRSSTSFGGPKSWGGAQFLMCDGTVRLLSEQTDPKILRALATPNGGEPLP